jgi:hypothetical protein
MKPIPIFVLFALIVPGLGRANDERHEYQAAIAKVNHLFERLRAEARAHSPSVPLPLVKRFTCGEARTYAAEKVDRGMSPNDLLDRIAAQRPDVILLGDTHSITDYAEWAEQFYEAYRKRVPKFDCVFIEQQANAIENDFFEQGLAYFRKSGAITQAIQSYSEDRDLPYAIYRYESRIGESFNYTVGEGGLVRFSTESQDNLLIPPGARFSTPDAQYFFERGLKRFAIDDRVDIFNVDRNVFMAGYMAHLKQTGACRQSVFFGGKSHLRPLQHLLRKSGLTSYTIGFQNSNRAKRVASRQSWEPGFRANQIQMSIHEGFLDFPGCGRSGSGQAIEAIAIEFDPKEAGPPTHEGSALQWNSFDAQIIAPVTEFGKSSEETSVLFPQNWWDWFSR